MAETRVISSQQPDGYSQTVNNKESDTHSLLSSSPLSQVQPEKEDTSSISRSSSRISPNTDQFHLNSADTASHTNSDNENNDGNNDEKTTHSFDQTNSLKKSTTTQSVRKRRKKKAIWKLVLQYGKVYVLMLVLYMGILSIYWGSYYNRPTYYKNVKRLVVLDEDSSVGIAPYISEVVESFFTDEDVKYYGNWKIYNTTQFAVIADKNNNTIEQEVYRQVHHQYYWAAIYVRRNATLNYYTALKSQNNSYSFDGIDYIYETARNIQTTSTVFTQIINTLEKKFVTTAREYVTLPLIKSLSTQEQLSLIGNSTVLATSGLWFNHVDYRPVTNPAVIGPLQVGMLYLLVLSFHQFNFARSTHEMMIKKLKLKQYLVYHIIVSDLAYFFLSLVYCLMTKAFQIQTSAAFGKSGFLVMWAIVFLEISALGSITENCALQIFARYKTAIGFWIVFFLVANMTVIFSPQVLVNRFYRYGYASPMHCGNELLKVVLLDTWKGQMGWNIGIMLAWVAAMHAVLPFTLKNVAAYTKKVQQEALDAALAKSK